jgi:sigma-54 dependent transcriptional regulator, acetoin dehydrogenase operon transcriptional activator AcoR
MNIRELEKALAAAVVLAAESPIECDHLPPQIAQALVAPPPDAPAPTSEKAAAAAAHDTDENFIDDGRPLGPEDQRRRDELTRLLREHKGNISAIARVMGKARMQIQRWMKRYDIDPASFRR